MTITTTATHSTSASHAAVQPGLQPPRAMTTPTAVPTSRRWLIIAAFAAMYFLWGGSYLGIRFSLESFTPFMVPALRFLLAGVILFPIALAGGAAWPTLREWRGGAIAGLLMFVFNNALLVWCQSAGLPSGVASLIIAISPLWFVLIGWAVEKQRPTRRTGIGLLVGFGGLLLLINPTNHDVIPLLPALGTMLAGFFWVAGSFYARSASKSGAMAKSASMATATQLLCGGVFNLILAGVTGELARFDPAAVSLKSWAALLYLAIAASIIALNAYMFLLRNVDAARVSTYAYVNPMVAVALGALLAGETITRGMGIAAAVIVLSVVVVTGKKKTAAQPSDA